MTIPASILRRGAKYVWDATIGRYRNATTGRVISRAFIRAAIDQEIRALDLDVRDLTASFRRGDISLGEWEMGMREIVKTTHVVNAAAARGGWDQLTVEDLAMVSGRVARDYNYLDGFAGEVSAGFQSVDGMTPRALLYSRGGRATYHQIESVVAATEGEATEERSILHPADHCEDCLNMAELGWQPIGTLIPIGERQCVGNCQCSMDYR